MVNTAKEALEFARHAHESGTSRYPALCLRFVRECFGVGSYYMSAADGWRAAKYKHPINNYGAIPRGVPVWWLGGSQGYGHVALSAGNGMCWSNDVISRGQIHLVSMASITSSWGQDFQGWTEDINTVTVYSEGQSEWASGDVYVSKLVRGTTNSDSVRRMKYRLKRQPADNGGSPDLWVNDVYGPGAVRAVKKWQRAVAANGPDDGTSMTEVQANRLFGENYNVIPPAPVNRKRSR